MTPLEETLGEVLSDFGIRELPPEWNPNGDTTLVDGIALVLKATGKEYVRISSLDGKIYVVKDYGQCSIIIRIEKTFAVNTMTKFDIPQFKNDAEILHYLSKSKYDRAEIEALLSKDGKTKQQIKDDRAEIDRRINDLAISAQKRKIAEKKRCEEIKIFAEKAREEKEKSRIYGRRKKKVE